MPDAITEQLPPVSSWRFDLDMKPSSFLNCSFNKSNYLLHLSKKILLVGALVADNSPPESWSPIDLSPLEPYSDSKNLSLFF
jgi:hypothetical protein